MRAIITGGSSGLGYEMAKQLRLADHDVIIIGTKREKLEKAREQLEAIPAHAKAEGFAFDISDEKGVAEFFKVLRDRHAVVDYLFNVAGKGCFGSIENITDESIMDILRPNLLGLMLMTAHGVSHFKEFPAPKQRIVSVLSTAALKGKKNEAVYNASKWGARGFLESVRDEVSNTHIEVINTFPGGMITPFWDNSTSGYPVETFMKPEDVAKQIVTLALDHKVYVSEVTINRPRPAY